MAKQIFLYAALFYIFLVNAPAQEVVTGLQSDFSIKKAWSKGIRHTAKAQSDTLQLPFFDDFYERSVYPDTSLWSDDYAFINNTYSDQQITTGVATLDALDNSGRLYETASSSGFKADLLTSRPIDLGYPATENIWLSFFYQPGGLADYPEAGDSLTLEFLDPDEGKWHSAWRIEGSKSTRFVPVIIKIDDSRFLKKGFQFRFINYASLSQNLSDPSMVGNCDIWNIDYVLLDRNRNDADTVFSDVAFRLPLRSLLKSHEAMPWKQFRQVYLQEMGSSIPVNYRNNDIVTRNVTRNFQIWDVYEDTQVHFFTAGATDIEPLTSVDYNANLIYTFNTSNNDSALFRITCSLKTDAIDPKGNDTLVYFQDFRNYFAFDDGTSEGGYGINGLGSRNAMVACRFESFIQDTLRAISICFNDSYQDANKRAFDLMIWDDNNGLPGNARYTLEEVMVEQGEDINGFYTYVIPGGLMVDGPFFIGWKQRSETFLNAGFDVNTPHEGRQYYWINGEWRESQVDGTLMIRAVVGDPLRTTSVNDVLYGVKRMVKIWPNPAGDYINIDPGERHLSGPSYITIIDMSGRIHLKVPYNEQVNISSLRSGIYIVVTSDNGIPVGYNRLIKTK